MQKIFRFAAVAAAAFACGGALADDLVIDSKKEVLYECRWLNGKKDDTIQLGVMYGMHKGRIVAAQVKLNDVISPGLFPVENGKQVSRFASAGGTLWTTEPLDAKTLDQKNGGVFSVRQGKTNRIVVDNCKLDKAATAKLKP